MARSADTNRTYCPEKIRATLAPSPKSGSVYRERKKILVEKNGVISMYIFVNHTYNKCNIKLTILLSLLDGSNLIGKTPK